MNTRPSNRFSLSLLPALLLLLVTLVQAALVRSAHFAPSGGTSFGMMASTDESSSRQLLAWREEAGGERPIEIPDRMQYEKIQVLTLPSQGRLESFARNLAEFESEGEDLLGIRVEVWRTVYEPRTLRPRAEKLREYTHR